MPSIFAVVSGKRKIGEPPYPILRLCTGDPENDTTALELIQRASASLYDTPISGPAQSSQGSSVHENSSTQMESKVKGSDLRLPCPVRYGDPEFYANVTEHCKAGKTFKGMRGVIEHLKDFHFPKRWCDKCNMTYERREKKFHLHQNEQRQSECKTNDNDSRQSNNEKSKLKQNQSKNNKSKMYPPQLSKAVAEQKRTCLICKIGTIGIFSLGAACFSSESEEALSQGGGTSAPPSTVARSEIIPNDLPSPSSAFPPDDDPIYQKIGGMGAVGGGHILDPSQWPVIEEEDSELFS
ncbi:hypothetical protein P885DRAFT_56719 [Corynascus similis CBS 632.67]